MTRLPSLALLILLLASQASAQPATIRSAQSAARTGRVEKISPQHLANEQPDTLHYQPIAIVKNYFTVNSGNEAYGSDQDNIDIVNGPDGTYLCAWIDHRSWAPVIDAQLFARDGKRIGPLVRIPDQPVNQLFLPPRLAFNAVANEYDVVWAMGSQILLQRLSITSQKIGVNTFLGFTNSFSRPSIATDSSGNIYVTWIDFDTFRNTLLPYCQIVSRDGVPITGQLSLSAADTASISSVREDRSIAIDGSGRCFVVWNRDIANSPGSQIVLQSVSKRGNLYKHPLVVNEADTRNNHRYPTIACTKDGHFFILWQNESTIFGRVFHPDSGFVSPQMPLAVIDESYDPYAVSSNGEDKFFVIWKHDKIFGQVFSVRGEPIGAPAVLPVPTVSALSEGVVDRLYLGYGVYERSVSDVMVQAFDLSFTPIGMPEKTLIAPNSAAQLHPVTRYNRYGQALVVWTDRRNGYNDLYGQLIDAGGNPLSSNFQINDTTSHVNVNPSIASDADGNFLVSFASGDYYRSNNVRIQRVFSNGMPGGGNIDAGSLSQPYTDSLSSVIQTDSVRNALVYWWSGMDSPLYSRRFDAALNPTGTVKRIFSTAGASPLNIHAVSVNRHFNTLLVWTEFKDDLFDCRILTGGILKAIVIDEEGRIIRDTMVVGVIPQNKQFDHATCRIDDEGNMLFVWTDLLVGPRDVTVHARRIYPHEGVDRSDSSNTYYTYSGAQILKFEKKQALIAWNTYPRIRSVLIDDEGNQFSPIDLQTTPILDYVGDSRQHVFSADCHDNLLFTVYQKVAGDRSFDIFANVQFFGRIGSGNNEITENNLAVYPNPVRQRASFRYAFSKPTEARISVYNILGQKIADIVQGMKPPGQYTVQFPTRDLPAGVYFFVLNGIKTSATKFIVVK